MQSKVEVFKDIISLAVWVVMTIGLIITIEDGFKTFERITMLHQVPYAAVEMLSKILTLSIAGISILYSLKKFIASK